MRSLLQQHPRKMSICNPIVFVSIICLCLGLSSCGGGSSSGGGSGPSVGLFSLIVTPSPLVIVPNSTITITVKPLGAQGTTTLTLGTLPAGITTNTAFPLSFSAGTANITFKVAANLSTGSFTIPLNGQSGSLTTTENIPVTIQNTPVSFSFATPLFKELGVGIGGSGKIQFTTVTNSRVNYDIALSVTGLPSGTTATFTPGTVIPGQTGTMIVTAGASTPILQNVTITLTGTPQAPAPPASVDFLLDVTQPPGSLPDNRTGYVSLESNAFSAVYDPLHRLVFASNPSWNRVDVISTATQTIVKSIPIPDSRSVDITQDNSRVWVGTGGNQIYEINTVTLTAIRHPLPNLLLPTSFGATAWDDALVLALADGTVMMLASQGVAQPVIWDPVLNTVTVLVGPPTAGFGAMRRTGDGKRVYVFPDSSGGMAFFYDVIARTFSTPVNIGFQPFTGAVNFDGTRVVADFGMFDGNFNFLGIIPGTGISSLLGGPVFDGGTIFSSDTGLLYEVSMPDFTPVVLTIDPNTLSLVSTAPAIPMKSTSATFMKPPFFLAIPFAVDNTGMVMGLQDYGIAFDAAAYSVNFSPGQPGTIAFPQQGSPQTGPLSGGTVSQGFGPTSLTPDVWYGANRAVAQVDATNNLTVISPPGSAPGPVNVKMLFPDGIETFNPLSFSYGPFIQSSVQSGAAPNGGSTGQIAGHGLPASAGTGTLTVGSTPAPITSSTPTIPALTFGGYPFPASTLNFSVPPGVPGFADVTVTTPAGSSTFPKAIFYAQSVADFSSTDTFTAILYDGKRQQLYLAAGDHIDVFSLTGNQFITPLSVPSQGPAKELAGMALSPDGSTLLAADLTDGSLAVISPDNPALSSFVAVTPADTSDPRCTIGPLYVATSINSQAYVSTGGLPGIGCGPGRGLFQVDLAAKTSTPLVNAGCSTASAAFVSSSHDGTKVAFDNCVYDATTQVFNGFGGTVLNLQAISGDGNLAAGLSPFFQPLFSDATGNIIGRTGLSDVNYGSVLGGLSPAAIRQQSKLNDAGSLFYWPWPHFFDIVDVQHGALTMRFSLAQTISDVGVPMAIDSGGRHIYLLTDRGLTIVDLGAAPLSVGSLTAASASPGTQIIVRGSGFDSLTSATLGGQPATVSFVDENTLNLVVPSLASGPADLVLENANGVSYTLQGALTIP